MDDAIRLGRTLAQAFQVFEIAAMHVGPRGDEGACPRVRPRQSEDLMTCLEQVRNDGRTDEAGRASEEHAH